MIIIFLRNCTETKKGAILDLIFLKIETIYSIQRNWDFHMFNMEESYTHVLRESDDR